MPAHKPSEVHSLFLDAFNRGDLEGLVALYEPDAVLVISGRTVVGREAIREAYQRLLAGHGQMELETCAVIESGEGQAVLHSDWTLNRAGTTTRGLSTELVRRQPDGTWLFVIDEPRTPTS
jgi:uncharacterized protein (TIGR02246 family)